MQKNKNKSQPMKPRVFSNNPRAMEKRRRRVELRSDPLVLLRKMLLLEAGLFQADLAESWQRSGAFVSDLINGMERSYEFEQKLAETLSERLDREISRDDLFSPSNPRNADGGKEAA